VIGARDQIRPLLGSHKSNIYCIPSTPHKAPLSWPPYSTIVDSGSECVKNVMYNLQINVPASTCFRNAFLRVFPKGLTASFHSVAFCVLCHFPTLHECTDNICLLPVAHQADVSTTALALLTAQKSVTDSATIIYPAMQLDIILITTRYSTHPPLHIIQH
jgi:hypothetical protein